MTFLAEPDQISLEAQVHEANRLIKEGDSEGALALLAPLTSNENAYLPARFLLAMTAWKMGRIDSAIELMRDCHEKWPMDGTVAEALASLQAQTGNFGESLFMGKLATALGGPGDLSYLVPQGFPIFDSAFYNIQAKPLLNKAKACLAKGEVSPAMEYVRQHSVLNPTDGDSHAFLAALSLRVGMASEANEVLSAIVGKIADDGEFPAPYVSLYAHVLTAVGQLDEARALHEKAVALAPDNAEIAAARIVDGAWLDNDTVELATQGKEWAQRFCASPEPRQWHQPGGKLVIGYIVSAFADPRDIAAVAAVAALHDRKHVTVLGYGAGAQSWTENALLSGAFDKWQDVSALDPETLARFFMRGGLHLVIDAAGFAAPHCLRALARLRTALRVSWLGNPAGLGAPVYDAQIAGMSPKATDAIQWRVGGGYPILAQPQLVRAAHSGINFGADANMSQLDRQTVALWSAVLQSHPEAKLLLRSRDMAAPGGNIDRLVERFGRDLAAKINIVDERADEFYASVDVALMPCRSASPYATAEAISFGVPTVALDQTGTHYCPTTSFLQEIGLGSKFIAASEREYVNLATELAIRDGSRKQSLGAIATVIGEASPQHLAKALEEQAIKELASAKGLS